MRRALFLVVLVSAVGCRPESYGLGTRVVVPEGDPSKGVPALPRSSVRPEAQISVPSGSSPRVLRPDRTVRVEVPVDQALPRGMRADPRGAGRSSPRPGSPPS